MLTLRDAVRIEEYCKRSFADVVINGSEREPVVKAKNWTPLPAPQPCDHRMHTIAKGIMAFISPNGHLGKAPSEDAMILYDEIEFCTRPSCERVFRAEVRK